LVAGPEEIMGVGTISVGERAKEGRGVGVEELVGCCKGGVGTSRCDIEHAIMRAVRNRRTEYLLGDII
jgi:hypothetical protein